VATVWRTCLGGGDTKIVLPNETPSGRKVTAGKRRRIEKERRSTKEITQLKLKMLTEIVFLHF
jgi:hypothetical protein